MFNGKFVEEQFKKDLSRESLPNLKQQELYLLTVLKTGELISEERLVSLLAKSDNRKSLNESVSLLRAKINPKGWDIYTILGNKQFVLAPLQISEYGLPLIIQERALAEVASIPNLSNELRTQVAEEYYQLNYANISEIEHVLQPPLSDKKKQLFDLLWDEVRKKGFGIQAAVSYLALLPPQAKGVSRYDRISQLRQQRRLCNQVFEELNVHFFVEVARSEGFYLDFKS